MPKSVLRTAADLAGLYLNHIAPDVDPFDPTLHGRAAGSLCAAIRDRLVAQAASGEKLDEDPGSMAESFLYSLLSRGKDDSLAFIDDTAAPDWLATAYGTLARSIQATCAACPAIDPYNSGTVRLVGDLLGLCRIEKVVGDPADAALVANWLGVVFQTVLKGLADANEQAGVSKETANDIWGLAAQTLPWKGDALRSIDRTKPAEVGRAIVELYAQTLSGAGFAPRT